VHRVELTTSPPMMATPPWSTSRPPVRDFLPDAIPPNAADFVKVGDRAQPESVVGITEAMIEEL
jgi:hypothetical protein